MEDHRIWTFEKDLWTGDAAHYRDAVDNECLMVLPAAPDVLTGMQAIEAVAETPRWSKVTLSEQQIVRPQEGLIVVAYKVVASKDQHSGYEAYCTSTYRRLSHGKWRVVQHQQTLPPIAKT